MFDQVCRPLVARYLLGDNAYLINIVHASACETESYVFPIHILS